MTDHNFEDITSTAPPASPVTRLTYDGPKGPLFKALAEARKHFTSLSANATADVQMKSGGKYQFSYAPLDVVLDAIQPGLVAAGLALLQPFDGDVLYTIVAFEGSSLTVETPLPQWSTPQDLGSLLTYLRRYQVKGIFGVADSEDDDGNTASGNRAQVSRKEPSATAQQGSMPTGLAGKVIAACKAKGLDSDQFNKLVFSVVNKKWRDCTAADAEAILKELA